MNPNTADAMTAPATLNARNDKKMSAVNVNRDLRAFGARCNGTYDGFGSLGVGGGSAESA